MLPLWSLLKWRLTKELPGWDKDTSWPIRVKLEALEPKDVADGLASIKKLPQGEW